MYIYIYISICIYREMQLFIRLRTTVGFGCKRSPWRDIRHCQTQTSQRNFGFSCQHIKKNNVEQRHDQTSNLGVETNAT